MGYRDRGAISEYESGKRRLYAHDLPAYAAALGTSAGALLGDAEPADEIEAAVLSLLRSVPEERRDLVLELLVRLLPLVVGAPVSAPSTDELRQRYRAGTPEEQAELLRLAQEIVSEGSRGEGHRRGGGKQ